ncbi:hypothetical protein ENUP19_0211G0011 [Entamoeba nuttalli]|uniref:RNA recognition motif (RRM, RBD, or RNP domain) containing protein n=2 Tax=Entamoeba nuttalli TaxID=412467 RepID=K2G4L2_ENTNP|nr:RNA recognition motif (RRM, RBD, or RNP domain) containing protein [Entamoeba nuttalli P19]EKE37216.1 RNA recognition motif (RRM, RBD, or RNP domain) containing protein [Entamoeba nuttalli P19]|eukprot:XP_008860448.1 RNA recognition motif (RRM, RBD, or RNP domain) containing protein [Entamoeba nuttalli P19]
MPKEGLSVLTEKQLAFFFPKEEEETNGDEIIIKRIYAISENVERRKNIQKFTKLEVPSDSEDIVLVFPSQIAQAELAEQEVDEEEVKKSEEDVICSGCGEKGHFFFNCPHKDSRKVSSEPQQKVADSNIYVPIHMRRQADGDYNPDVSIRLSNIPASVDETVIKALYHKVVGNEKQILRIFFPKDYVTGERRDYCFINVATKEIAQNAISKLDGYLLEYAKLACAISKKRQN